jgi:TonB family protein
MLSGCASNEPKSNEPEYGLERDGKRMSRADAERAHANAPHASTWGELDTQPKILTSTFPTYPQRLVNDGVMGDVSVQFYIEADGTVSSPTVVGSPPPELAAVTSHAIMQWKFSPGMKDGKPVRVRARQTFKFKAE